MSSHNMHNWDAKKNNIDFIFFLKQIFSNKMNNKITNQILICQLHLMIDKISLAFRIQDHPINYFDI